MGPSIGTRSAIDGEVNLRCWDAFVIGLQKQILCREIKEEEGKAVEVGISLLVILVGHIDKKINSEMNTGVYILQEFWR